MSEMSVADQLLSQMDIIDIIEDITRMVREVRMELARMYDVVNEDSQYYRFCNLCNIAVELFIDKLEKYKTERNLHLIFKEVHGEQAHRPDNCYSINWDVQHTWCVIKRFDWIVYVDPTSSQFQDLYDDIPDFYISPNPPKWYYDDRVNKAFNGFWKKVNAYKITFKDTDMSGNVILNRMGCVEFFQYYIWGDISDFIRKFILRK